MERTNSQSDSQSAKRQRQQSGVVPEGDGARNPKLTINELLCYATKKYHQLRNETLKQILYDFYKVEIVSEAKNQLSEDIDALSIDDWPKPPRRRLNSTGDVGGKLRIDIDDIMKMLDYVDRMQLGDKLPKYVAVDPDMLPSAKLTEGDLQCVLIKIGELTNKIEDLRGSTIETNQHIAEMVAGAAAVTAAAKTGASTTTSDRQSQAQQRHLSAAPPGPLRQPPLAVSAGSAVLLDDPTDGATSNDDWDTDPTVQVQRRRSNNRPRNARPAPGPSAPTYAASFSFDRPESGRPGTGQQTTTRPSQARRTILGSAVSSSLKASKNLKIKKAVFKISNIDAVYTAENLLDHLTNMGIRVADDSRTGGKSCFELKPGPRQPAGNKCFRICIFAADKPKLLVKEKWESGILIQEWIFHPKDPEVNPPSGVAEGGRDGGVLPKSPHPAINDNAMNEQSVQT